MNILAIDTSAVASSVAVCNDFKLVGEMFINVKLTHSQTLLPSCTSLLSATTYTLDDIDLFAVSAGPGSFTGLRIGIAAIKGMALCKNKPIVAVSTLEALAHNLSGFDGIVCAVMDARCNQVYNAIFESSVNGKQIRLCDDRALPIDELATELKSYDKNIFLVGDGAELCYNKIELKNIFLAPEKARFAKGSSVGFIAFRDNEKAITADTLMPTYLRIPQAERERNARLGLDK